MSDQKKSVAEIIEEMRRELRDEKGPDSDLFVSTMTRETRAKLKGRSGAKKKIAKKKAPKKGVSFTLGVPFGIGDPFLFSIHRSLRDVTDGWIGH